MDVYRHVQKSTYDLQRVFGFNYIEAYLNELASMGWRPISVFMDDDHFFSSITKVWHFIISGTNDLKDPLSPWEA